MGAKRFTKYCIFIFLLLSGMIMSCQKDEDVKDSGAANQTIADTTNSPAAGNYLALKGTLKITIQDSTYSFDALRDSIAFVSLHSGNSEYFGITAINKDHNMSFGISSLGHALSNSNNAVTGGQFLMSPDGKPNTEYSLTKYAASADFGKINLAAYKQDSVLAKGTFYTFLARDDKASSPFIRVKGTFSLMLK